MNTLGSRRVMLVDDDPDIRLIVSEFLRASGFDVVEAVDGREGLALLRSGVLPCVILLDLMMPVMDGWEFRTEQLRDPVISAIPIVVYTGATDPETAAIKLGAEGYVAKSASMELLLESIKRVCSGAFSKEIRSGCGRTTDNLERQ